MAPLIAYRRSSRPSAIAWCAASGRASRLSSHRRGSWLSPVTTARAQSTQQALHGDRGGRSAAYCHHEAPDPRRSVSAEGAGTCHRMVVQLRRSLGMAGNKLASPLRGTCGAATALNAHAIESRPVWPMFRLARQHFSSSITEVRRGGEARGLAYPLSMWCCAGIYLPRGAHQCAISGFIRSSRRNARKAPFECARRQVDMPSRLGRVHSC